MTVSEHTWTPRNQRTLICSQTSHWHGLCNVAYLEKDFFFKVNSSNIDMQHCFVKTYRLSTLAMKHKRKSSFLILFTNLLLFSSAWGKPDSLPSGLSGKPFVVMGDCKETFGRFIGRGVPGPFIWDLK